MRRSLFAVLLLVAGPAWSADITLPNYERIELENGAVLLLSEKHDVPLIGLRAVIRGGSITDSENKAGLTELLATVMQKGAGSRDAAEFAAASANVGGRLSINAGVEAVIVSAEFLSRDTELLIELVASDRPDPGRKRCQPEQPDDLLRRRLPVRRPPVWQPNHRQRVIPGGD
jgi:hypothetical protein